MNVRGIRKSGVIVKFISKALENNFACEFSKYPPKHDVAEWLTIQTLCDSERKGFGLKIQMGPYGSIGAQSDRGHISQKKGCTFFV